MDIPLPPAKKPEVRIDFFEPYGSSGKTDVMTKVGSMQAPMPPKTRQGKVVRLNARTR